MEPDRLDLGAIDPMRDDAARERLIGGILEAAAPELARRAAARSPLALLSGWARPTLAAAATLAVVSAAALALASLREPANATVSTGLADELAVPAPVDAWLVGDLEPTTSDVLYAFEGEVP